MFSRKAINSAALSAVLAMAAVLSAAHPASAQVVRPDATTIIIFNASNNPVTCMLTVPGVPTNGAQSDGCPTGTINSIRYVPLPGGQPTPLVQFANATSGWFVLQAGQRAQILNVGINPITKQVSSCLQGCLIGFGQIGNQCADRFNPVAGAGAPFCEVAGVKYNPTAFPDTRPGPSYGLPISPPVCLPNGTNAFEFTVNLPGTINGQKTFSIGSLQVNAPTQEAIDISCVNGANCALSV